jgi:hypothetical protein
MIGELIYGRQRLFRFFSIQNINAVGHACHPVGSHESNCLIIGVFKRPAWPKYRHDDNALSKFGSIA